VSTGMGPGSQTSTARRPSRIGRAERASQGANRAGPRERAHPTTTGPRSSAGRWPPCVTAAERGVDRYGTGEPNERRALAIPHRESQAHASGSQRGRAAQARPPEMMMKAAVEHRALAAMRNGGRAAASTGAEPGSQTSTARRPSRVGTAERARRGANEGGRQARARPR
jgi:hypothetical protein